MKFASCSRVFLEAGPYAENAQLSRKAAHKYRIQRSFRRALCGSSQKK
jgi:hypothetical protein